jgi:hypothetical protein
MVFHPLARFNRVAFEIISDNTRKFLGVKLSPRSQTITGTFAWVPPGPSAEQPPMLRLTCTPALPRLDAGSARPSAAFFGVAALTTGRAVMAAGDAVTDPTVVFDAMTSEQVGVLVGDGPELRDWAANGTIVRFRSLLGEPTLRLGYRITLASGQEVVLVSAEDGVPFSEPYLPAATVDAAMAAATATHATPAPAAAAPAPASAAPASASCARGAARSAAGTAAAEDSETSTSPAWASAYPLVARLLARVDGAALADLSFFDDLVGIFADEAGNIPRIARTPPSDIMARIEWLESEFDKVLGPSSSQPGPMPRPANASRAAAFAAARSVARLRAPATGSAAASSSGAAQGTAGLRGVRFAGDDLSESMSRAQFNQAMASRGSSTSAPVASDVTDPAAKQAAAAIERENLSAAGLRPLYDKTEDLLRASQGLTSSGDASTDRPSVVRLGEVFGQLPQALATLEAADDSQFAVTSALLSSASSALRSSSLAFTTAAARVLRGKMLVDPVLPSPEREVETQRVISLLLRGKPLSITERLLLGKGSSQDVLAPLEREKMSEEEEKAALGHVRDMLSYLSFAVRLFYTPPPGETDVFDFAADSIRYYSTLEGAPLADLANAVRTRLHAFEADYSNFLTGLLPAKPRYSRAILKTPEAVKGFEDAVEQGRSDRRWKKSRERFGVGAASSAPAPAPAPAYAARAQRAPRQPRGQRGGGRGRGGGPAVAVPVAIPFPPGPPPVPPVPPAAPAAATPTPAVNMTHLIIGEPFQGPATVAEMRAFSDANGGRCFNFWRRGSCARGDQCGFSHV